MRATQIATLVITMLAIACAADEVPNAGEAFELVFVKCPQSEFPSSEYSGVPRVELELVVLTLSDVESYNGRSHTFVLKPNTVAAWPGGVAWLELERYSTCGGFEVRVHGRCVYSGRYHSLTRSDTPSPGLYLRGDPMQPVAGDRIVLFLVQPCSDLRDDPALLKVFEDAGVLIK